MCLKPPKVFMFSSFTKDHRLDRPKHHNFCCCALNAFEIHSPGELMKEKKLLLSVKSCMFRRDP